MRIQKSARRVLGTIEATLRDIDAGRKQMTENKRTLLKAATVIRRVANPRPSRRGRRNIGR